MRTGASTRRTTTFRATTVSASTLSQDLRSLSKATARDDGFGWLAGVYALRLDEDNRQRDEFAGELLRPCSRPDYEAVNAAAYGEAEWRLGARPGAVERPARRDPLGRLRRQ